MKRNLLTLSETSARTKLTEKALRMKIFRRQFPYTKISGRIFVEEGELEKFLDLSRKTTAEEAAAKEAA